MYYIYHIEGVKVGCTQHLTKRMREQGFTKWEILETHTDEDIADARELELIDEYGYEEKYTHISYKQSVANARKSNAGFKVGHTPWNKGVSHSAETIEKISKSKIGKTHSKETKEKQRLAGNNNKSDEYRKAQSERIKLWWAERKKNNK